MLLLFQLVYKKIGWIIFKLAKFVCHTHGGYTAHSHFTTFLIQMNHYFFFKYTHTHTHKNTDKFIE